MTFSRQTRVLLALGSGIALALSFPNYNLPLLAWISIGMLVLASFGAPPREAPLYGFLHAFVFYPICLPWIATVMRQYGNVDPLVVRGDSEPVRNRGRNHLVHVFDERRVRRAKKRHRACVRAGAVFLGDA